MFDRCRQGSVHFVQRSKDAAQATVFAAARQRQGISLDWAVVQKLEGQR
jgi:hypothetical protein